MIYFFFLAYGMKFELLFSSNRFITESARVPYGITFMEKMKFFFFFFSKKDDKLKSRT